MRGRLRSPSGLGKFVVKRGPCNAADTWSERTCLASNLTMSTVGRPPLGELDSLPLARLPRAARLSPVPAYGHQETSMTRPSAREETRPRGARRSSPFQQSLPRPLIVADLPSSASSGASCGSGGGGGSRPFCGRTSYTLQPRGRTTVSPVTLTASLLLLLPGHRPLLLLPE